MSKNEIILMYFKMIIFNLCINCITVKQVFLRISTSARENGDIDIYVIYNKIK